MVLRYVGDPEVYKIHDETLRPLIKARLAEGVSATTINCAVEGGRVILHRAARVCSRCRRDPRRDTVPPLITMLRESARVHAPSQLGRTRSNLSTIT